MTGEGTSPERQAVWRAMAAHFLDTETRPGLPLTAFRCLEAGLACAEARIVWRYEVFPAVGPNLLATAGAWAGWDDAWLFERIERLRNRWDVRPGAAGWLRYRLRSFLTADPFWRSLERFILFLQNRPKLEREEVARDLAHLARHYFDFAPQPLTREGALRLRALYPVPFSHLLAPVTTPQEAALARHRAEAALRSALDE